MHETDPNASPFNPLPWVVWALALPMIAMELVLSLAEGGLIGGAGGIGWRIEAVQRFAVAPMFFDVLWQNRLYAEILERAFVYPFVHLGLTQTVFAVVLLLALGKMVAGVFRPIAVLVVFFGAALAGAAAFVAFSPAPQYPLIGGYPAVYGLIGAFTFLLWVQLIGTGHSGYRAFTLIGMLLGIQLVFGIVFGGGFEWIADLAGFAAGFLLSFVVSPGGWQRVMARFKQR